MKRKGTIGSSLYLLIFSLLLGACSNEELNDSSFIEIIENSSFESKDQFQKNRSENREFYDCNVSAFLNSDFEENCQLTDFGNTLNTYFNNLTEDPLFDLALVSYYQELNKKYVSYYEGPNYYGEDAQFDQLAKKRIRELESFWNLDREIYLNGQHMHALDDREILAAMIESFDNSVRNRTEAYEKADELIRFNKSSPNFPENPTFALDAFTKSNGLLVIGDGLLKVLVESGIDENIAFTGILAHEWWHQAQFEYSEIWTFKYKLRTGSEFSRFSELEADFAASYYMSHKRGATFNWKRIEEFFQLSYNVGDCLVESSQHHGTPKQRMAAAKFGYELAESAKKKGHVLQPTAVHQAFVKFYSNELKIN